MGDHVDAFCPACFANIGFGTFEVIGCPVCGFQYEDFEEEDLYDDDFYEEEFIEEDFEVDEDDPPSSSFVH